MFTRVSDIIVVNIQFCIIADFNDLGKQNFWHRENVCTFIMFVIYCLHLKETKGDFIMRDLHDIELFDCPICRGPGLMQEENGWCLYVECLDCGSRTAELRYTNEEERVAAALHAASTWNVGKVIASGVGE